MTKQIRLSALVLMLLLSGACTAGYEANAQSLRELFLSVKSSVVVVRTLERGVSGASQQGFVQYQGLGSGVLISEDGKVLTAAHVVQIADRVGVEFEDGTFVLAQVVASVPTADIALLQLEEVPPDAQAARLGDSDVVAVGDPIFIIGSPYELSYTLTAGYISARRGTGTWVDGLIDLAMFQTDAAINKGNSGGPMFNMNGEVVGIVSSILSRSGGFEGLGFAVTSNTARLLLLEQRSAWSGMDAVLVQGALAHMLNVPQPVGLLVQRVAAGSPAADSGLRAGTVSVQIGEETLLLGGDIILEISGISVDANPKTHQAMRVAALAVSPGDSVRIKVLRAGAVLELSLPIRVRSNN